MATIQFHGDDIHTSGTLPEVGTKMKDFNLVDGDLGEKSLADFTGKKVVYNIFPSVNTGVCANSVRNFNEKAAGAEGTVVLCISKDLPFAQGQFCGAEGIENVVMLSDFRSTFAEDNGLLMTDGPLKGLCSRVVIVTDQDGKIVYTEQVPEITQEPNYEAALDATK